MTTKNTIDNELDRIIESVFDEEYFTEINPNDYIGLIVCLGCNTWRDPSIIDENSLCIRCSSLSPRG